MKISVTKNGETKKLDLLKEYGKVTLKHVTVAKDPRNTIDPSMYNNFRATINTEWFYNLIFNSLTDTLKNIIEAKLSEIKKDRATLLKIVTNHAIQNTNTVTVCFKKEIQKMYLKICNYNIERFL